MTAINTGPIEEMVSDQAARGDFWICCIPGWTGPLGGRPVDHLCSLFLRRELRRAGRMHEGVLVQWANDVSQRGRARKPGCLHGSEPSDGVCLGAGGRGLSEYDHLALSRSP